MQRQASVLVIDDEPIVRSLLVESLSSDGFDVEAAESGRAALSLLKSRRFDIALTDLKMPGMDGIETLRALKEADREIQVVVMTGYASLETAVGALKGGACDYIEKPLRPLELAPVLQRALDRSHLEGLLATYGASRLLLASMGLPDLCRLSVDLAEGVFHADAAGLVLIDPSTDRMEIHTSGTGELPDEELLKALHRESARLDRPFSIPSDEGDVERLLGSASPFSSAIVYPLHDDRTALGALCMLRRPSSRCFGARELERGILFSSEISRALLGARLRRQLEEVQVENARLEQLVERGSMEALEGRLAAGLAGEMVAPVRRVCIGVNFLKDAFSDFSGVIKAYQNLVPGVEGASPDDSAARRVSAAERQADIGYLLEQAPRAIDESLDGAAGASGIVEAIQRLGSAEAPPAPADLNAVIESVVGMLRPELEPVAAIELEYGDIPQAVCRPGRIGAVLIALLRNAAEAVRAVVGTSGERGRIGVSSRRNRRSIVITVSDTGCGIPERSRERVFEPRFTTGDPSRLAGMGLFLARRIVEDEHGGSLALESSPGEGTAFTIRLPVSL